MVVERKGVEKVDEKVVAKQVAQVAGEMQEGAKAARMAVV